MHEYLSSQVTITQILVYKTSLICYNFSMKQFKPLIETNPYLKDPTERENRIARSVRSSCAVEGISEKKTVIKKIDEKKRVPKNIYRLIER